MILGIIIIGIRYLNNKIKSESNNNIKTNLLMIQGKVKIINGRVEAEKNEDLYLGCKISELAENDEIKNKVKNLVASDDELSDYYLINSEELVQMGLSEITSNYEYIVNYKNEEVIYINGIEEDGRIVYKLSELIKKDNKNIFKLWE